MAYFDAFIVITSLIIDLSFLRGEKNVLGEHLIFILTFRLWRFVRIISSVGESIRHGQTKHKTHLNRQYLVAVHRLVDLLVHKTSYIENNAEDNNSMLEHFRMIDNQCQSSLTALNENYELTSSTIVAQLIEELEGLENKSNDSAIRAIFVKPPDIQILHNL